MLFAYKIMSIRKLTLFLEVNHNAGHDVTEI